MQKTNWKLCMLMRFFLLLSCLMLNACSLMMPNYRTVESIDTTNLSELENVHYRTFAPISATDISKLRFQALQESAMTISAQGGLAWASRQINANMERDKKYLETIYNFPAMMLSHGVLPPVLEEGNNSLNLADPNTIRVADKTYKIVAQARFATTPPNWREYLILNFVKPELPDKSLLPRNAAEQKVWREAIQLGWLKGIEQASSIFQQSLARLRRDYRGMILYRKLLQERMVSPPFVARTELGVTGDGENMRINDQVLRIVESPQLQTNSKQWKAIVVPQHE